MLPQSDASPTYVRIYIAARRFRQVSYSTGYGVRLHLPEGVLFGIGGIRGTQPVVALKRGLETSLDAVANSDRDLKLYAITRTEALMQSLDAGRTRKKKKQYGISLRQLKTDEELYERTPLLWALYGGGGRMFDPGMEEEDRELRIIERELDRQFFRDPGRFRQAFDPAFDF